MRLTVEDDATGVKSDVHVDCEPSDRVSDVLTMIGTVIPVQGTPVVDGGPLTPEQPVAVSPLRDGSVLHYGRGPQLAPVRFAPPLVLRVVSGAAAGTELPLVPGQAVVMGRAASCQLVLDDPDVSRKHAQLVVGPNRVTLADLGSRNGVLLDGRAVAGAADVDGKVIQIGGSRLVVEALRDRAAVVRRGDSGEVLLNRTPRSRPARFEPPTVAMPAVPADDDDRGFPVLPALLPLVAAVVMALVLRNAIFLLFGLLSPLMLIGSWWTERRRQARRGLRNEETYHSELTAARVRIEAATDDEDADLRAAWPDPATTVRTAITPRAQLWERQPADDDWLAVRLGRADRPAAVKITGDPPQDWSPPVLRLAPLGISLVAQPMLGLAGPPGWVDTQLAWVVTQLAVHHSPDELRIAVIAPDAGEEQLGWLRWLPHLRTDDGSVRAGWDAQGAERMIKSLGDELQRRSAGRSREPSSDRRARPDLVVVLAGTADLRRRPQLTNLLNRGPAAGLRFVCAETDERQLPDGARARLVATGRDVVLRVDRGESPTVVPDEITPGTAELVARALAPVRRVGDAPGHDVPSSIRLTELAGEPEAGEIRAAWGLLQDQTEVVIGADADGPVLVDIARDGPHALVAGISGSGKSDFLRTLIAGLARANPPTGLNFLFLDYKGGATFKDLDALPHVVGSVTNLDTRLAARALSSLRAELNRRQAQLAAAGAEDLADYRRRALADPTLPPFPRLVVVADELAELEEQLQSLVDGLVNVARIGRSLGVHLVLATQKAAGVVDGQIRANTDLRVCLRVKEIGDSQDVIDTPDAAYLPNAHPGRALLVRGGGPPQLLQTARITAPRRSTPGNVRRAVALRWFDMTPPPAAEASKDELATDLNVLVDAVRAAADAEGLTPPYRPWLPPLPPALALDALPPTRFAIPLGLWDRPQEQRQDVLEVPLGSGHLAIVGSGRSGRTTALRAVAVGLARAADAAELHLHVVDGFGGLSGLDALPHTGVVVAPDDSERLERLLNRLATTMRDRRRDLSRLGATSVAELWSRGAADAPPHVVLLVDGWEGLLESVDGAAQTTMLELLSGGAAAGVTVCLAGDERILKSRLLARLTHRLCLRLNNPTDATLLGLQVRNLPEDLPPGRALWAGDGGQVQVPLLATDPSGPAQAAALADIAARLHADAEDPGTARAPMRLDRLPEQITLADATRLGARPTTGKHILLGVSGDRLSPVWASLDAGPLVIAGPAGSGRSTAAAAVAASAGGSGLRVLLGVHRRTPVHECAAEAGVEVVTSGEVADVLNRSPADLVVLDDVDRFPPDDDMVERFTKPDGPSLAVVALLDSFGFGATGLLKVARTRPGSVVLLCPPNHLVAANVGVTLERGMGFSGPPGRAYLVAEGRMLLGQVPEV
ncbi:S-DNA-T family DNA segregation ATPase FtsK/SpoIIIE [Pseudonocardia hierapolitana]|uniref:S-DNA-T family DNA segregation ATPase FtsK/SpoIIIE n=1 Tax=Pseudonocardia hierapolitana TaxID=1128676 RepID=A0A561SSS6_9PSEU|nr:FtsK/SpoIIIE domain-containing protein [Pseudonocardia hierapolitana]TWF77885.1 S-DNA-T family DNA segregation ATPase FtsK/SpoIIIE [Pseudonocardia hierapolitana]